MCVCGGRGEGGGAKNSTRVCVVGVAGMEEGAVGRRGQRTAQAMTVERANPSHFAAINLPWFKRGSHYC